MSGFTPRIATGNYNASAFITAARVLSAICNAYCSSPGTVSAGRSDNECRRQKDPATSRPAAPQSPHDRTRPAIRADVGFRESSEIRSDVLSAEPSDTSPLPAGRERQRYRETCLNPTAGPLSGNRGRPSSPTPQPGHRSPSQAAA